MLAFLLKPSPFRNNTYSANRSKSCTPVENPNSRRACSGLLELEPRRWLQISWCGREKPKPQHPKGPCHDMVYTWALKGVLYPYFGVYVCTISGYMDPWGQQKSMPGRPRRAAPHTTSAWIFLGEGSTGSASLYLSHKGRCNSGSQGRNSKRRRALYFLRWVDKSYRI